MLQFTVENQTINRTDNFNVVADSQNYLTAEFTFSEEWSSPATAVFRYDEKYYNVLMENNRCIVPWEVIKAPFFTVSVFCGDRITANAVQISVEKSGYAEGETPGEPTPDVYARLIELSEETKSIAQSVRSDADNGLFDGKDGENGPQGNIGPQGPAGQDGYTPRREIDYWTESDKAEIVAEVESDIETTIQTAVGETNTAANNANSAAENAENVAEELQTARENGEFQGERGYSGLVPKQTQLLAGINVVSANTMTEFDELYTEEEFILGEGVDGYDNEWAFTITYGNEYTPQITLPTIRWGLGIAPTFGKNTTTLIRLYYIGGTLCGEWVTV